MTANPSPASRSYFLLMALCYVAVVVVSTLSFFGVLARDVGYVLGILFLVAAAGIAFFIWAKSR